MSFLPSSSLTYLLSSLLLYPLLLFSFLVFSLLLLVPSPFFCVLYFPLFSPVKSFLYFSPLFSPLLSCQILPLFSPLLSCQIKQRTLVFLSLSPVPPCLCWFVFGFLCSVACLLPMLVCFSFVLCLTHSCFVFSFLCLLCVSLFLCVFLC